MNSVASLCRKLNPGQETSPVQTCSLFHCSLDMLWLNLMIESILRLSLPYAGREIQVSQEDKVQWLCSPGTSNIQEPCRWGWNTDLPQWHVLAPLGNSSYSRLKNMGGSVMLQGWLARPMEASHAVNFIMYVSLKNIQNTLTLSGKTQVHFHFLSCAEIRRKFKQWEARSLLANRFLWHY